MALICGTRFIIFRKSPQKTYAGWFTKEKRKYIDIRPQTHRFQGKQPAFLSSLSLSNFKKVYNPLSNIMH